MSWSKILVTFDRLSSKLFSQLTDVYKLRTSFRRAAREAMGYFFVDHALKGMANKKLQIADDPT